MPYLAILKNHSNKFPDPRPYADDFRNLTCFSLSTDTSLLEYSRWSDQWFLREDANIQTDRQINKQTDKQTPGNVKHITSSRM